MVQTRNQYRTWRDRGFTNTQESEASSQHSNENHFEYNDNHSPSHQNDSRYKDNDHCHRHRKTDDSPYTEEVTSYRRRKA
jgi:hypothetical protein